MANKGYTTNAAVAAFLGATLTGEQQSLADTLIGAAEALIDRETRRGWLIPPVTAERHDLLVPTLYTHYRPIASVEAVTTRTEAVGAPPYTAIAGVDYELFDAGRGQINFSGGYAGPHAVAFISYTPLVPVPEDIAQAATLIVANALVPALLPEGVGVQRLRFGQITEIIFTPNGVALEVPAQARMILDGHRLPIF